MLFEPMKKHSPLLALAVPLVVGACTSTSETNSPTPAPSDEVARASAVAAMHDALLADAIALRDAAQDLKSAAPTPPDRGWDTLQDKSAIVTMRDAWVRARTAYEHVEGALAPLFPSIDFEIDARYDDFMTALESKGGDKNPYDAVGVTGMHAIERILYADVTPARVIAFEKTLPNSAPASLPPTSADALAFRNALATKLVDDAQNLVDQWTDASIDPSIAYFGLVSLVQEQREKVRKASSSEEESRYSQRTMADLRDNLAGTKTAYKAFAPWLVSKAAAASTRSGTAIDADIQAGFAALDAAYAKIEGEAIPEPPATWSAENPTTSDLATPFGELFTAAFSASDPASTTSLAAHLREGGAVLGLAGFETSP
jgi:iron uptake system component EfeO